MANKDHFRVLSPDKIKVESRNVVETALTASINICLELELLSKTFLAVYAEYIPIEK